MFQWNRSWQVKVCGTTVARRSRVMLGHGRNRPSIAIRVFTCLLKFFFHECGRRVGGVPRSSLKGKETQHDEGKRAQATPKPSKTHQTKTSTKNQKATTARSRFPLIKTRFLCTRVRQKQNGKSWLLTNYGPEFTTKVGWHGQRKRECSGAYQRGLAPPTKQ